jgi:hypothetical protein
VVGHLDVDGRLLNGGVLLEVRAHELAVERPVVFGVRRRVHADVAAAAADPGFERRLSGCVQRIARGHQEHDDAEAREVGGGERGGIFGRLGRVAVRRPQRGQRRDGGRDRIVTETDRAREQQHGERAAVGGGEAAIGRRAATGARGEEEAQGRSDA